MWRFRPLTLFPASYPEGPPLSVVFADRTSMAVPVGFALRPSGSRSLSIVCSDTPPFHNTQTILNRRERRETARKIAPLTSDKNGVALRSIDFEKFPSPKIGNVVALSDRFSFRVSRFQAGRLPHGRLFPSPLPFCVPSGRAGGSASRCDSRRSDRHRPVMQKRRAGDRNADPITGTWYVLGQSPVWDLNRVPSEPPVH